MVLALENLKDGLNKNYGKNSTFLFAASQVQAAFFINFTFRLGSGRTALMVFHDTQLKRDIIARSKN
jgi:hypothetical protein